MKNIEFQRNSGLIIVPAFIESKDCVKAGRFNVALDTAATTSVFSSEYLNLILDYDIPKSETDECVTIFGEFKCNKLTLASILCMDKLIENFPVRCCNIPANIGINGILGLDFLIRLNLRISFKSGSISIQSFDSEQQLFN